MDWWINKPSVLALAYDKFFNDDMIIDLMKYPVIDNWIQEYLCTDPYYRSNTTFMIDYEIVRKLSLFEISHLALLFNNIKDLPAITEKEIPIFRTSQKSKIKLDMVKINSSDIKAGMVIALPYKRYLQSEIMTDHGIDVRTNKYDDLFIFGIKRISHLGEKEYYCNIESYTCYEEFCYSTKERKIIIEAGHNTQINIGFNNEHVYIRNTLEDSSTCCDQAGPITTYTSFDIYHVSSPEKYF